MPSILLFEVSGVLTHRGVIDIFKSCIYNDNDSSH